MPFEIVLIGVQRNENAMGYQYMLAWELRVVKLSPFEKMLLEA